MLTWFRALSDRIPQPPTDHGVPRRRCRVVVDTDVDDGCHVQPPPKSVTLDLTVHPRTAEPYVVVSFGYDDAPGRIGFPLTVGVAEDVAQCILDRVDEVHSQSRGRRSAEQRSQLRG